MNNRLTEKDYKNLQKELQEGSTIIVYTKKFVWFYGNYIDLRNGILRLMLELENIKNDN